MSGPWKCLCGETNPTGETCGFCDCERVFGETKPMPPSRHAPDDATAAIIQEAMDDEQRHRQREFWRGRPKSGATMMELREERKQQRLSGWVNYEPGSFDDSQIAMGAGLRHAYMSGWADADLTRPDLCAESAQKSAAVDAGVVERAVDALRDIWHSDHGEFAKVERILAALSRPQGDGVELATVPPPWCATCGKSVAEVLCPECAKWWNDNPPPAQADGEGRALDKED